MNSPGAKTATVLVTFLGRGRRLDQGYTKTCYRFEGGGQRCTPYFGLALLEELLAKRGEPLDRFAVLGTASSI